jgi:inner membrane transporter RhtA
MTVASTVGAARRRAAARSGGRVAGTGLAVASVASVQFGAALASTLFPVVGPVGIVLAATNRIWRVRWQWRELKLVLLFGAVLATMNTSLYLALDRLPLATTITLEFLGPLAVAVGTASSRRERWWVVPAAAGVALLGGTLRLDDLLGVAFALSAALCWACYILLSNRLGRSAGGQAGLALATVLAAVVMLPIGFLSAGSLLWHPSTLAVGLAVGVLSSALPYSMDMMALRRLPTAVFGVLTSLNPAVGALAGWLVLSEQLPWEGLAGVALVIAAGAGITLGTRRT